MSYDNTKFKITPVRALKELNDLLAWEYLKGKRKININKVLKIVEAGLHADCSVDTSVKQQVIVSGSNYEDSTATRFPNSGLGGVIG